MGGAILDDGGHTISVLKALQHDSTLGERWTAASTKKGSGTLTLTANNTYTGNTTVSAAKLALSGSGAIGSSAAITLAAGTTLDASGIAGQALTLNSADTGLLWRSDGWDHASQWFHHCARFCGERGSAVGLGQRGVGRHERHEAE